MKTETQIAQKNIENWKFTKPQDKELWRLNIYLSKCQQHKATCQRFLEFLEESIKIIDEGLGLISEVMTREQILSLPDWKGAISIKDKITDLKQAIKLYNEAGI